MPLPANPLKGQTLPSRLKLVVHSDRAEAFLDVLESRKYLDVYTSNDYAGLPAILEKTTPDILFTIKFAGTPGYPREAIFRTPTLRWISVGGSGTDHLGNWDASRITVTNAAGVAAGVIAEYVIGSILHFSLEFPHFRAAQVARSWSPQSLTSLAGTTMAIIGVGHTGKAVARLAKAFGMHVIGVRSRPRPMPHLDRVEGQQGLASVLTEADWIVVCVPLTDVTRGLIDRTHLAMVKRGAVLVDISRGGVVDQTALAEALSNRYLRGAVLDVFENEPLATASPLWAKQNVIVTAHSAGLYDGWERVAVTMFCENLDRWRAGERLRNIVDPGRGY